MLPFSYTCIHTRTCSVYSWEDESPCCILLQWFFMFFSLHPKKQQNSKPQFDVKSSWNTRRIQLECSHGSSASQELRPCPRRCCGLIGQPGVEGWLVRFVEGWLFAMGTSTSSSNQRNTSQPSHHRNHRVFFLNGKTWKNTTGRNGKDRINWTMTWKPDLDGSQ